MENKYFKKANEIIDKIKHFESNEFKTKNTAEKAAIILVALIVIFVFLSVISGLLTFVSKTFWWIVLIIAIYVIYNKYKKKI